jgi:hypothetical protein
MRHSGQFRTAWPEQQTEPPYWLISTPVGIQYEVEGVVVIPVIPSRLIRLNHAMTITAMTTTIHTGIRFIYKAAEQV